LQWYSSATNSSGGTPTIVHPTVDIPLPQGQTDVSGTYDGVYRDANTSWYWGVNASTTPAATSGDTYATLPAETCQPQ
jgi:hypothetical protein